MPLLLHRRSDNHPDPIPEPEPDCVTEQNLKYENTHTVGDKKDTTNAEDCRSHCRAAMAQFFTLNLNENRKQCQCLIKKKLSTDVVKESKTGYKSGNTFCTGERMRQVPLERYINIGGDT